MNTTENNRLIAEFMGLKPKPDLMNKDKFSFSDSIFININNSDYKEVEDRIAEYAKYHTSWDWLMPVLKKIIEILYAEYPIYFWGQWQMIFSPTSYEIEKAHKQAVEFIKWHNQ